MSELDPRHRITYEREGGDWTRSESVAFYTLRIMGPPGALPEALGRAISEAEENISDLLPEGYYCKIEEA